MSELVYDFPAHDFIIDFRESVRLFNDVELPSQILYDQFNSETLTPLSPLNAKDRIIRLTKVVGCPIHVRDDKRVKDESASKEPGGSGGQPPAGGT